MILCSSHCVQKVAKEFLDEKQNSRIKFFLD